MRNKEYEENNQKPEKSLLRITFEDGSVFNLPQEWEDVFVDYYGSNPKSYPDVGERLRFVTSKYVEHKAWPSKFDGLQYVIEEEGKVVGDDKYDDPEYYWQHWDEKEIEWGVGKERGKMTVPPMCAEVAEAVMYQSMRGGILQKALQQLGSSTRVVTPERFLRDLKD